MLARMTHSIPLLAVLAALLACNVQPVAASPTAEVVRAEVLPGWRTEGLTHMAALQLTLSPGWKTYWRSPGDAGIPPQFDWAGSENVRSVRFHWPRPQVFNLNGLRSIGYRGELILPMEVTAIDPRQPIRLRAVVDLGVCRDICLPASLTLDADLPGTGAPDAVISAALHNRPATGTEAGLARIVCHVEPIADGLRLTAEIDMPSTGSPEVVVVEAGERSIWVAESVSIRAGDRLTATTELVAPSGQPFMLNRSALTVTVLGQDRAVEITGCPAP